MQFNMGIDLGGANVRMALKGRGVVLRQSAAVAVRRGQETPVSLGNDALQLLGRASADISVAYPMRGGAIAREDLFGQWLRFLFASAAAAGYANRPRLLLLRAGEAQSFDLKRISSLALDAGAASCAVIRAELMTALGAGLPILKPEASLIVDVGATRASTALISLGRVVEMETLPYGAGEVDRALKRLARAKGVEIGLKSAEELKLSLASAVGGEDEAQTSVAGLDARTGFPRAALIAREEAREAAGDFLRQVCEIAAQVVERAPIELAADLAAGGLVLAGGGAQIYGLDKRLSEATGLDCRVPEDPSGCAVRALAKVIDAHAEYEDFIEAHITQLDRKLPGASSRM